MTSSGLSAYPILGLAAYDVVAQLVNAMAHFALPVQHALASPILQSAAAFAMMASFFYLILLFTRHRQQRIHPRWLSSTLACVFFAASVLLLLARA